MATQDTAPLKERIVSFVRFRGPSLPVHIAQNIGQSLLFTSAFLSELLSEKRLKASNMRVGSSPLYFISGQEEKLENFSSHLKSKEKDAFILLKQKRFLKDKSQEPAIRVALREIKDFAIPFQKDDEIYFRYFTIPETELSAEKKVELPKPKEEVPKKEEEPKKEIEIFDDKKMEEKVEPQREKKVVKKKSVRKKTAQKTNEKFFNTVKEYLASKQIDILDIVGFSKTDLILKIGENGEEKILVAYSKKSIREEDIVKAHKKAEEFGLKFVVLSSGEPLKKLSSLISAIKNLDEIKKLE